MWVRVCLCVCECVCVCVCEWVFLWSTNRAFCRYISLHTDIYLNDSSNLLPTTTVLCVWAIVCACEWIREWVFSLLHNCLKGILYLCVSLSLSSLSQLFSFFSARANLTVAFMWRHAVCVNIKTNDVHILLATLSLSLSLFLSLVLSLCVIYFFLSLCLARCLCLLLCRSLFLSLSSLFRFIPLAISLSFFLSFYLSFFLSIAVSLSLSLFFSDDYKFRRLSIGFTYENGTGGNINNVMDCVSFCLLFVL